MMVRCQVKLVLGLQDHENFALFYLLLLVQGESVAEAAASKQWKDDWEDDDVDDKICTEIKAELAKSK
jgi:hypothetical protein